MSNFHSEDCKQVNELECAEGYQGMILKRFKIGTIDQHFVNSLFWHFTKSFQSTYML